jgi:hypothetical protein
VELSDFSLNNCSTLLLATVAYPGKLLQALLPPYNSEIVRQQMDERFEVRFDDRLDEFDFVLFRFGLFLDGAADFVLFDHFPFFFDRALGHDAFLLHSDGDALVPATTAARAAIRAADLAIVAVRAGKPLSGFDRAPEKAFAAFAGHHVEMVAG